MFELPKLSDTSQEKIDEIALKLAEILRIQDWDIQVHAVSGYEIAKHVSDSDSTNQGVSVRNMHLNTAQIYLNRDNCDNWYETLIHELIHVQTTMLIYTAESYIKEKSSFLDTIYESFVDRQAVIISKLYPAENFNHPTIEG